MGLYGWKQDGGDGSGRRRTVDQDQDDGWVQLLAAPQPQVCGVKAQVPKGLPGRLQSMA